MPAFRRHVEASGLDMKPVGVEYLFDGEKAVCYFAAEERVDFRQLVRDLSREFHVRIDMRQIGVREEAAIVAATATAGRSSAAAALPRASTRSPSAWPRSRTCPSTPPRSPVRAGRLMCCLRYEFEAYRDFKSRAPKRNAVIDTPLGKAKIIEYDTPKGAPHPAPGERQAAARAPCGHDRLRGRAQEVGGARLPLPPGHRDARGARPPGLPGRPDGPGRARPQERRRPRGGARRL